jgi:serine/threonine-protein kinase
MMSAHSLDAHTAPTVRGVEHGESASREPMTISAVPESEPPSSVPALGNDKPAQGPGRPLVPTAVACGDYAEGTLIAQKYRLVRALCQGGMGAVWLAHNELLDMDVALKLIRHDLRTTGLAERLLTEARLAAKLEHPAVVSVFDVGNTEHGDPYIVMELLRGEDLRELLEREGQLEPVRSVQCLLPILEGLAAAHARGIVHRDLKPENVYFTHIEERIQPKIVDFGIAKPTNGEKQRCVTRSGAVVGSPDYMSPEQARGLDDVDHRADIWAFAVVLYECLTSRPPFADSSYETLLRDVVEKPITPMVQRGVDEPELWEIIARGLAKEREERWQTAREMGVALALWLRARGVEEDICGQSLRATWLRDSDPPRDAIGSAPVLLVSRAPRTPRISPYPVSDTADTALSDDAMAPGVRTPVPTPVRATLPSPAWLSVLPPPPVWSTRRKLVGATAVGAALVVWGLAGTLLAGAGTASASARPEALEVGLANPARSRAEASIARLSREAKAAESLRVEDIPVLHISATRSASRPATSAAAKSVAPLTSSAPAEATTAPVVPRKTQKRWAPFVEQDLGF